MIIDGYDYGQKITHVIPLNDLQEHSETISEHIMGFYPVCNCECSPKSQLNPDNMGWIIIHSAFDGREAVEEFYETLKQKQ